MRLVLDRLRELRLRHFLAVVAAAWIVAMLYAQWLVLLPASVLYLETKTRLPLINGHHILRANLSKPLSPPSR